jgi:hypothetical protein
MNYSRFRNLGILLVLTSALSFIITIRLSQRGHWLPKSPDAIGAWTATDMPIPASTMASLGTPPAYGRSFVNPFNERVEYHVIATASFAAYHEPAMCMAGYGYTMTAEKQLPVFGNKLPVRALILKNDTTKQRVLLYYWVQHQDGSLGDASGMTDHRQALPRIMVGMQDTISGSQSCIVRAYTEIHPSDPMGIQARRNLNEICTTLYNTFKAEGKRS